RSRPTRPRPPPSPRQGRARVGLPGDGAGARQVGAAVEEHRSGARQPLSAAGRQGDPVLLSALAAAVPSTPHRARSAGAPGTRSVAGPLPELPHTPTAP